MQGRDPDHADETEGMRSGHGHTAREFAEPAGEPGNTDPGADVSPGAREGAEAPPPDASAGGQHFPAGGSDRRARGLFEPVIPPQPATDSPPTPRGNQATTGPDDPVAGPGSEPSAGGNDAPEPPGPDPVQPPTEAFRLAVGDSAGPDSGHSSGHEAGERTGEPRGGQPEAARGPFEPRADASGAATGAGPGSTSPHHERPHDQPRPAGAPADTGSWDGQQSPYQEPPRYRWNGGYEAPPGLFHARGPVYGETPPHPGSPPDPSPHSSPHAEHATDPTLAAAAPATGAQGPAGVRDDEPPPAADDAGPGAAPETGPGSTAPGTGAAGAGAVYPAPRRGLGGLLVATLTITALVIVGSGAFVAYRVLLDTPGGPDPAGSANRSPTRASPPPPQPTFNSHQLLNIQVDAKPLTLREEFPQRRATIGGRTFQRVSTDMKKGKACAKAARLRFSRALRRADCRRVLRATFVDSKSEYTFTVGVAVLPTKAAAKRVKAAAVPDENVWFRALRGPGGARKIHRSGGLSTMKVVGHYAVFSFAAYANQTSLPPDANDLNQLSSDALEYAMGPIVSRGMTTPSA